ncbi:hypothetical protein I6N95_08545 [Vagococcus sp. BWB3-3]|uniref:Uncharacterized protein n=1 Tax=Vagococcus allomyrinae TaxID=2794353 RepID=A0A940PAB3_9ENTE|nr:hypothetical protein [Vagococcus allomyrinae]MBP1041050.1 hypothetical protein [Vagococcus allomyrinae]
MRQRLNPVKTKTPSDKIRTGQSFLYRKNGFESMVLEIQLKKNIDYQPLTEAFGQAIDRFDYLSQRLISEAGDFFLVTNPKPFIIRNDSHFLPLGGLEVNDHLLDIHYLGHTLYIAYHHAICDGRGILPFVRTFLYYYLKGDCQLSPIVPDIQLSGSPLLRGETTEPALPKSLAGEAMPTIQKNGFSLPEAQDQTQRLSYSYLFQIKLDSTSMMTYARSLKASPATLLASLFSETIQQIHPRNKQAILCNLVTDLRGASQQLS